MSHESVRRLGSLRNCQFSSYVGSGYLRAGSGVGVWAMAGEAVRTADATRTKVQRENISFLLHERLRRGLRKFARGAPLPPSAVTAPERSSCGVRQRTAQVAQAR